MEITLNRNTGTIDIMVPSNRVSDKLLGVLPEQITAAEGTLAWSIRFGDVTRTPRNSAGVAEDALLGPVGAIVGPIASQGRSSSVEAEGKIQGALILTFNDSLLEESASTGTSRTLRSYAGLVSVSSASLDTLPRLREEFSAELNVTESQQISLGSRSTQMQSGLQTIPLWLSSDVGASNTAPLLFANPFAG